MSESKCPIVCICGSTDFKSEILAAGARLTVEGNVVLLPLYFSKADKLPCDPEQHALLKKVHFQKIELCDRLFVVNPGGYIGKGTQEEIEYALKLNKEIKYLK